MRKRLQLAVLALALAAPAGAADYPLPPSMEGARDRGCALQQIVEPDHVTTRWHVRVWVDFPDHRWSALYAIRAGNERRKALLDCDRWLKEARKRK